MTESLAVVLPVFVIILLGYALGRTGRFGPATTKGLTEFTFTVAVPALLFKTVATATFPASEAIAVWMCFFGALAVIWLATTILVRIILRRPPPDGASITVSATYGNVVMLGIPLSYSAYGPTAAITIAILMSIHTPLLWLAGTLHMALVMGEAKRTLWQTLGNVMRELARNPIVIAVLLGLAWQLTGLGLDPHIDRTLGLLAQASIPCSLVALGLSLVDFEIKGQTPTLALILVMKLLAMPAVAAFLALAVFGLDPVSAGVVILFAAMPTGANAFLFANRYQKAVNSASGAVALGTTLSAPISALVIYLLR